MEFIPKSLAQLHRGLLVSALQVLAGGDRQSRSEVLQWVFADPTECSPELMAGDAQALQQPAGPILSFLRCCEDAGLDPERLRERLLRVLARLGHLGHLDHRAPDGEEGEEGEEGEGQPTA